MVRRSERLRVQTLDDSEMVNADLHLDKDGNLLFVTNTREFTASTLAALRRPTWEHSPKMEFGTIFQPTVFCRWMTESFLLASRLVVASKRKTSGSAMAGETRLLRDFTNGEEDVTPTVTGQGGLTE